MYLHLDPKDASDTKSKRMRDLIKRSTTKQLLISKPDIKQTNDKTTVNIYVYDRLRYIYNKKLLRLKNKLFIMCKQYNVLHQGFNTTKINIDRLRNRKTHRNSLKLVRNVPNMLVNTITIRKNILFNLFLFKFLKWVLKGFDYNVMLFKKNDVLNISNNTQIHKVILQKNILVINKGDKFIYEDIEQETDIIKCINGNTYVKFYSSLNDETSKNRFNVVNIVKINRILLNYVLILNNKGSNTLDLNNLFIYFQNKYMNTFTNKFMRKQRLMFSYLYKLYINKTKFGQYVYILKSILRNVYSKKIDLNFINLKYIHLNSDLISEAVAIKLRKKVARLLRILRKSIKLIKTPRILPNKSVYNHLHLYSDYRGLHLNKVFNTSNLLNTYNNSIDKLQYLIKNMFPKKSTSFSSKELSKTGIINKLLNSLKYKWVTGMRLEAKGRLTKRFTASRSLFKYKYKGTLRNLDYLNRPVYHGKLPNTMMIRNQMKPNLQYTFASDRKRIGVYGIKGWVSSS